MAFAGIGGSFDVCAKKKFGQSAALGLAGGVIEIPGTVFSISGCGQSIPQAGCVAGGAAGEASDGGEMR